MSVLSFFARQLKKVSVRLTLNQVSKKIKYLNINKKRVKLVKDYFLVIQYKLSLPVKSFYFILENFDLFEATIKELNCEISYISGELILHFENIYFRIKSKSDLIVINEIYNKQCYSFKSDLSRQFTVMDIGMNTGAASLFYASLPNVSKVFAYEPFVESFNNALFNFALNPRLQKKIFPKNEGMGLERTVVNANFSATDSVLNSIEYHNKVEGSKEFVKINDSLVEVQSVINQLAENEELLIKIDCEGCEFAFFERLFTATLDARITAFVIEWHKMDPLGIERKLIDAGFSIFSTKIMKGLGVIYAIK